MVPVPAMNSSSCSNVCLRRYNFTFSKGDIAVLAKGVGMLMVPTLKTSWAFDPGAAVTTDGTRYHIVAIVSFFMYV